MRRGLQAAGWKESRGLVFFLGSWQPLDPLKEIMVTLSLGQQEMAELPRIRPRVPQHQGWGRDSGRLVSKFLLEAPQVPWTAYRSSSFSCHPFILNACELKKKN